MRHVHGIRSRPVALESPVKELDLDAPEARRRFIEGEA
jgi:hypothetical protein